MSKILNTYNRKKISFSKGKGSFLYTTNGKKYLDFVQGIAVNCLGHANDYLIRSINKQSKKLWHVSNVFTIPEQERLAKRIAQKTFADYVTFQNSGAEATEAAIKFARRYFYSKGQPRKNRVLCINNRFHGRTIAAIFASNSKKAIEGFKPKVDGFDHFNFGDHKGLEKAITSRTAAIMVETIMGEGGIKVIPDFCLKGLRKLCNKKKILLILTYLLISFNTYVFSAEDKNQDLLKIGVLAPFSGELKELGEEILYSINIALHDLGNPKIKIFPEDSGSKNEKMVKACEKFQDNGIKIIIGPVESKLTNKLFGCQNLIFLSFY